MFCQRYVKIYKVRARFADFWFYDEGGKRNRKKKGKERKSQIKEEVDWGKKDKKKEDKGGQMQ